MNIFEQVFRALNRSKIQYLVVGGVAVNLYGYVRFTGDLDILVVLNENNLQNLDLVMRKLGYSERLPVSVLSLKDEKQVKKWLKEKGMKAYTFNPPRNNPLQIDIVIEESLNFQKFAKNVVKKKIENVQIPLISIADLISMKKRANRDQDVADIKALLDIQGIS